MPKDGFDDLNKFLEKLEQNVSKAGGEMSLEDLFNEKFMKKYTEFNNIQDFFNNSPFEFETDEEFEQIDEKELDQYVAANTQFPSWEDMMVKAGQEELVRQLGL